MSARLPWLLIATVLLPGCMYATFVRTDQSFAPAAPTTPAVYIDRLPPFGYRPVGIIEVTAPAAANLADVMATAARKGAEVGCDVVVDRSIHRVADADVSPARLLYWHAQYYTPPPPPPPAPAPVYYAPPPSKREFVCGVAIEGAVARPAAPGI